MLCTVEIESYVEWRGLRETNEMTFTIIITPSAQADIKWFKAFEQRIILNAIRLYLQNHADEESNRRKMLRMNPIGPWELKESVYRVFYAIEEDQ